MTAPPDAPLSRTASALRAMRLQRAQRALDRMFHAMPLGHRVRTGLFMAFKTMLSACVAYAVGHALHTEQAFWAAISAVAVTQPHFGDTRGAGRDRCLGSLLGAGTGLLGLWLDGGTGSLLVFALALGVVTVACWTANAGAAARVAGITTAIVLLVPANGPRWEVALYRVGEVVLGTICALLIGWLVSALEVRAEHAREEKA